MQGRYALPTLALGIPDVRLLHPHQRGIPLLSEAMKTSWNPQGPVPVTALDAMFREMNRLETKPFTFALPRLVTLLDRILGERGMVADVVCDDDEEHNLFSTFAIFEELQCHGHYQHLRAPSFASSEAIPFLQLADLFAYVLRRGSADERLGRPSKPEILRWFDLIQPQLLHLPTITARDEAHHYAMMAEYIIRNSGGPHTLRRELLATTSGLLLRIAQSLSP